MAAEITLADLLAWEPRLRVPGGNDGIGARTTPRGATASMDVERDLSWAITVRASAPMLPQLRGGELILLPRRVLAESGVSLPLLLRELASHGCAGVVLDGMPTTPAPLPILVTATVGPDLEGEINRLLTQRRGELYRAGTEVERLLVDLAGAGAELPQVLTAITGSLGIPAAVIDSRGGVISATGAEVAPPMAATTARGWQGDRFAIGLAEGRSLWLGPVPRVRRALTRLIGDRLGAATDSALARAAQTRPRGPARAAALLALMMGQVADPATRATTLGLSPDGVFRIAFASEEVGAAGLQRLLSPLGTIHEAGVFEEITVGLVEMRSEPSTSTVARRAGSPRIDPAMSRVQALNGPAGPGWVALSGPALGANALVEAAREARFATALLTHGLLPGPLIRFDVVGDMGAYRLLYRLWGTAELRRFWVDALGELPQRDRRGTLRRTLLAYLETGGSHVESAARLGIHRNTLAYRLKQIAAFTGRDPTDPAPRLLLHLALLAASLPSAPT